MGLLDRKLQEPEALRKLKELSLLYWIYAKILRSYPLSDLPDDVVIETNSIVGFNDIKPINIGNIPTRIKGLIQVVKAYEELTVEAAVTGDYYTALQALSIHPLIPSVTIAKKILDDIIKENKEYLPQYK